MLSGFGLQLQLERIPFELTMFESQNAILFGVNALYIISVSPFIILTVFPPKELQQSQVLPPKFTLVSVFLHE